MAESAQLTIGGRRFVIVDFERRTLLLDCYLRRVIEEIGITKIWFNEGESELEFGLRLQMTIVNSGKIGELLAGYLLPEGITERQWTKDIAADTAAHLGACDTAADRELCIDLAREVAGGFFRQWLVWFKRSLSFFQARQVTNAPIPSTSRAESSTAGSGPH